MTVTQLQTIVLAGPRGFCAGVDRASDIVELALQVCPPPICVACGSARPRTCIS